VKIARKIAALRQLLSDEGFFPLPWTAGPHRVPDSGSGIDCSGVVMIIAPPRERRPGLRRTAHVL
jgi:hypothetical protein